MNRGVDQTTLMSGGRINLCSTEEVRPSDVDGFGDNAPKRAVPRVSTAVVPGDAQQLPGVYPSGTARQYGQDIRGFVGIAHVA